MIGDPTSAATLTATVLERLAATPDPRVRELMTALVRHLHAFAAEVALTEEEWAVGIDFLTRTGQACTGTRQEVILLSDTLGLSSLVDVITQDTPPGATESTVLGPFYVAGSPERANGESMAEDDDAQAAVITGTVCSLDGAPLGGATLDCWQTSSSGFYAVQQPAVQPEQNLRGRYTTNVDGRFEIRTVRPVEYQVPSDGPVGELLRATDRHPWRAAHVHAIVSAPGHRRVVTHIFDGDRPYLDSDAVFGVKPSLVRHFTAVQNGGGATEWHLEHDFVLAPLSG